ncbi:hypothetical protein MAR_029287 [Mya arenaria]|uniref:Helitron helicase-like domain-containing protein n=1 Tax=Mya arenaria TaxID=6604 RepID=A0ABY7DG03_MYAAR|nr:hypothetical protein MAR_029287 [Mya arenaria]
MYEAVPTHTHLTEPVCSSAQQDPGTSHSGLRAKPVPATTEGVAKQNMSTAQPNLPQHSLAVMDYSPLRLDQLLGDNNTKLPYEIPMAMLNLMKAHTPLHSDTVAGYYTPVELMFLATQPLDPLNQLPLNNNFILIHHLTDHWFLNAATETEPAPKPDLSTTETDGDANNQSSLGQSEVIDSVDEVKNENSADFITDLQNSRAINSDTCIQPVSGPEIKTNEILNLAPGEGKKPITIIKEPQWEALAFPTLFQTATNTYYQETPRPSPNTAKQYKTVSRTNFCERPQRISRLLSQNQLFAAFRNIRGSSQYFKQMHLDMMAKLRQLGPYTFFITGSAAEFHWPQQRGQTFTETEVSVMNWDTKRMWLQRNPVTAARHIDYIFEQLWGKVILSGLHPVGEVLNYDLRKEMQGQFLQIKMPML